MKSLIIIPTYNEKENISRLVESILSQNLSLDILIIDDNSPDSTGVLSDELSKKYSEVKVIHRQKKSGLGTAYVHGFKYALNSNYDVVFEMDSDFSHHPAEISKFLDALNENKGDIIIGSRYINGSKIYNWDYRRYLLSKIVNILARTILKSKIHDCTSGYRCYKAEIFKNIPLDRIKSKGYCFQIEILNMCIRHGYRVHETPISFTNRTKGVSKMSFNEIFETLSLLSRIYFRDN